MMNIFFIWNGMTASKNIHNCTMISEIFFNWKFIISNIQK